MSALRSILQAKNNLPHEVYKAMNKKALALALMSFMTGFAQAQAAPNAGALLNQYNQESQKNDEQLSPRHAEKKIIFKGYAYEGLTPEEVRQANEITDEFLGKEVPAQSFIKYIEGQLERRFGLSVVFQELPNGKIKAIHPILGAIYIDNKSKLADSILRRTLENGIAVGKPLNRGALEERSMVANEIPGIVNQYRMAPGATPDSTDLYMTTQDGKTLDGYVGVDNNGTTAVGVWEAMAGITGNDLLGFGEKISINGLKTENGQYGGFFADAPVGSNDLRMGVNASIYTYSYATQGTSNNGSSLSSGYSGGASDLGINGTYVLSRSEYERSNFTFAYDHKENYSNVDITALSLAGQTSAASFKLSDWLIDVVNIGYNGMSAMLNSATASYGINASLGHAKQMISSAALADVDGPKQQGNYAKLNFQGVYSLPFNFLSSNYIFTSSTSGQLSNKNLPNSEKFYVGGLYMMKAWSPQITGGDNAIWLELKAEKNITEQIKAGIFAEAAYVSINSSPYSAISPNGTPVSFNEKNTMSDAGVIVSYTPIMNLDIVGTVAVKTSAKPTAYGMPIATTNNQTGNVMGFIKAMYRF